MKKQPAPAPAKAEGGNHPRQPGRRQKPRRAPAYTRDIEACNHKGQPVRRVRVELSRADLREAEGYARAAGLELDVFLDAAFGNRAPFARWESPEGNVHELLTGAAVRLECADPALRGRIERAARHYARPFARYVAEAIAASVAGDEDDMLFHPRTREVLASRDRLKEWEVADEWIGEGECLQVVSVPLGPQAQAALETLRLAFPAVASVLFLRAALEGDLRDAVEDMDLAGTVAAEGQCIGREKSSAVVWERGWGVQPLKPVEVGAPAAVASEGE